MGLRWHPYRAGFDAAKLTRSTPSKSPNLIDAIRLSGFLIMLI